MKFQSTRPVRGATKIYHKEIEQHIISIHAPRAGRDLHKATERKKRTYFNPRAPCGARLGDCRGDFVVSRISIHAPRAGRDTAQGERISLAMSISIHAPRAGRDKRDRGKGSGPMNFNPRAPCGARLSRFLYGSFLFNFNPRAPCGARQQKYTKLLYTLLRQKAIFRQFHAKRRLLKRFSTYKYRNTFLICSANRMGKICTLPLRTTRSLDLPEGMSACNQSARFCFRTFFPSSKTADYPAPDP